MEKSPGHEWMRRRVKLPVVSVITPVHDQERHVRLRLRSILDQSLDADDCVHREYPNMLMPHLRSDIPARNEFSLCGRHYESHDLKQRINAEIRHFPLGLVFGIPVVDAD